MRRPNLGLCPPLSGPPGAIHGPSPSAAADACTSSVKGARSAAPTILFEAGSFGFSARLGLAVQEKVVAQGMHACSYGRAHAYHGLVAAIRASFSAARRNRGGQRSGSRSRKPTLARDLRELKAGPIILVGHSMAGLRMQLFANRNPGRIAGAGVRRRRHARGHRYPVGTEQFVKQFTRASRLASFGASLGLYGPLAGTWLGDKYGLPPAASAEKRRAFADPGHNRTASAEVDQWQVSADQAKASGPLNPAWPVAVITAGHRPDGDLRALQNAPALNARAGYVENVEAASRTTLVGLAYSDAVVRGIDHVRTAMRQVLSEMASPRPVAAAQGGLRRDRRWAAHARGAAGREGRGADRGPAGGRLVRLLGRLGGRAEPKLATLGRYSLAYDRAGMGLSDPGAAAARRLRHRRRSGKAVGRRRRAWRRSFWWAIRWPACTCICSPAAIAGQRRRLGAGRCGHPHRRGGPDGEAGCGSLCDPGQGGGLERVQRPAAGSPAAGAT